MKCQSCDSNELVRTVIIKKIPILSDFTEIPSTLILCINCIEELEEVQMIDHLEYS